MQQAPHGTIAHRMPLRGHLLGQGPCAFAGSSQRRFRITPCHRINELLQRLHQFWIFFGLRFSSRAGPQCAAEVDERWSFVGAKDTTRWLWHASDHHTGRVLAYVVGPWKDAVFWILKALLASFGITRYYTDKASVYLRHLLPAQHPVGKLTM